MVRALKKWVKKNIINRRHTIAHEVYLPELAKKIESIISKDLTGIPVIVVSYNNGVYVENTCIQLAKKNIRPLVIDNASNDNKSIQILNGLMERDLADVVFSKFNFGHLVGFLNPVYAILPEVFAYTDPDLQFNDNLPDDFLNVLKNLTEEYKIFKVGFALNYKLQYALIDNTFRIHRLDPFNFDRKYSVDEWESRFWRLRVQNDTLELYAATVDTTFAVYRKSYFHYNFEEAIRIAGNYTCVHLPWYPELDLFNQEQKKLFRKNNVSSTWV